LSRLWDKGLPLDARVLRYTAGEDHLLDARLVHYDVIGSIAHVEMLVAADLIDAADGSAICAGLTELAAEFAAGKWCISLDDEDAHTALESRLIAAIGEAGARMHLGRSRNDQLLTALRLYLRDVAVDLITRVDKLRASLQGVAQRQGNIPLTG
jgi:argininosuccinate lyase